MTPKYRFFFAGFLWHYGYIVYNTGKIVQSEGWAYSDYIEIEPYNGDITFSYMGASGGAFYDKDKKFLYGFGAGGVEDISIPPPATAQYMRCNMRISDIVGGTASAVQEYVGTNMLERTECHPIYKDDMALEYSMETNQRFYRAQLSGKMTFVRDDYEYINSRPFDTVFFLYMEKSDDWGHTYSEYYESKFMKTGCTINDDDKTVTVQPETTDQYDDVLAGLEKEYNLVELAPDIEFLTIWKRPLIQVYVPGDSVVSCFLGGTNWEQDVSEAVSDTEVLRTKYHFSLASTLIEIQVTGQDGAPSTYDGLYVGSLLDGDTEQGIQYEAELYAYGSTAHIRYEKMTGAAGDYEYYYFYDEDGTLLYFYQDTGFISTKEITVPYNQGTATGSLLFDIKVYGVWARYLCDVEKINDTDTYEIPDDDIVDDNRNYHRVIGYAVDLAAISHYFSDEATEYGRADNGKYFEPPYSVTGQHYYPIAKSTWRYASIWFKFYLADSNLEEKARKAYTLRDTFTLSSCINVLLKAIAPGITHEATTEYSQFLYNASNPISGQSFKLLISQKSNIINGEYQTPAQKAPITLQQIMTMLRDVFKCYWYVDGGKFKIEHVSWFMNGGSYGDEPVVGYDLTQLENIRNGKKWAFATSEYSFDKEEMPERYQFEWMDEVTEAFEGLPIEITSKYVTAGKIEDISISQFTPDIDYMLLNPGDISSDGFALFAAVEPAGGGQLELPFTRQTINGVAYYLQNGYLAYINIQPAYWRYDMPAKHFTINGSPSSAIEVSRNKKQTLKFPAGDTDPDPMEMVKTYLGNAQIDKLSVNLCSRNINATLKYDTE